MDLKSSFLLSSQHPKSWISEITLFLFMYMTLRQTQFVLQLQPATCCLTWYIISKFEFKIICTFSISYAKKQLLLFHTLSVLPLFEARHIRHPPVFSSSRFERSLFSLHQSVHLGACLWERCCFNFSNLYIIWFLTQCSWRSSSDLVCLYEPFC